MDVTIKADTIHISQPMHITYQLKLYGRVVAITNPITMNMTSAGLFSSSPVEKWTFSERLVYLDEGITMRERRFGLVEIFDEAEPRTFDPTLCQPALTAATTEKVSH